MEVQWIDKAEVARRQLSELVRLFFEERDFVVIHTVIASAHQILFDIGKNKGVKSMLKNTEALRGRDLQDYVKTINYPYNFFKHADHDPDRKINIAPLERFTSDFIMDAIMMLHQITGDIPLQAKVFWFWFVSKYPQEFEDCPEGGEIKKMIEERLADWDFPTIRQFLSFCDIMEQAGRAG
jgi:hypothetical protein